MELKQYISIIRRRLWLIGLIVLIGCLAGGVYSYKFTTKVYQANAKLIVNQTNVGKLEDNSSLGALQMNVLLIKSYKEVIKTSAIMNKVVEKYPDLGISGPQMASNLSVSSTDGSQVMDLRFYDTSYKRAAEAVNAIAHVFKEQIPIIMNVDNINILNEADVDANAAPINSSPVANIIIAFLVSLLLSIGLVLFLDYLDQSYRTEEDIREDLELPVLATVPAFKKKDRSRSALSTNQKVGEGSYVTIQ